MFAADAMNKFEALVCILSAMYLLATVGCLPFSAALISAALVMRHLDLDAAAVRSAEQQPADGNSALALIHRSAWADDLDPVSAVLRAEGVVGCRASLPSVFHWWSWLRRLAGLTGFRRVAAAGGGGRTGERCTQSNSSKCTQTETSSA